VSRRTPPRHTYTCPIRAIAQRVVIILPRSRSAFQQSSARESCRRTKLPAAERCPVVVNVRLGHRQHLRRFSHGQERIVIGRDFAIGRERDDFDLRVQARDRR